MSMCVCVVQHTHTHTHQFVPNKICGGVVVKALCYEPAGRGFDSDSVIGIFQ